MQDILFQLTRGQSEVQGYLTIQSCWQAQPVLCILALTSDCTDGSTAWHENIKHPSVKVHLWCRLL